MPDMHLKQPGFTYSACGPFTKVLRDKAFNIAKNPKYDGISKRSCIYGLQIFW